MRPDLGVVAIGRNEGERLRGCLESLRRLGLAGVYVDSGSDDGSPDLARSLGFDVVALDMARPFSAARARNEGYDRLVADRPGLNYVMFLDGDCEVADGWAERALAEFAARPDAAVVCGRRREKYPDRTVYNRMADLEWDTPVGRAVACGGDSVMRRDRFEAAGRFDPTAAAGEEPELCQRIGALGWSIYRIDAEMTRHDVAMARFRQFWRRHYRSGYNGLDIATRFPGPARLFVDELARARRWGLYLPLAIGGAGLVGGLALGPMAGLAAAGLGLMAYPAQAARLAARGRRHFAGWRGAAAYGMLGTAAKWANLAGQLGYRRDRGAGRSARLIEYKRAAAPAAGAAR